MLTVKPNPRLRSRRHLNLGKLAAPEVQAKELDNVAVRHIQSHPNYDLILPALKEGMAITDIARWFAQEKMITVSEKTFGMYLYVFKRVKKDLILVFKDDDYTIDQHVRGDMPEVDIDHEMDRAIRFQKIRVGIGFNREKQFGIPISAVSKDMEVLGKFIELKAKRKGLLTPTGGAKPGLVVEKSIADKLANVGKDQEDNQSLYRQANELVEGFSGARG